jgi:hypothetical protein
MKSLIKQPTKKRSGYFAFLAAALMLSAFAGVSVYYYAHSEGASYALVSTSEINVQNVSLSNYNTPAIQGTTQANGTALYIPASTHGSLQFHIAIPQLMASDPPVVSTYLDGQLLSGCESLIHAQTDSQGSVQEVFGCLASASTAGSGHNVTIVVSSPFISTNNGIYQYETTVLTAGSS